MTTFTRRSPGTYTESTGLYASSSSSTVSGNAIQVRSNPERLALKGLSPDTTITLFFTPTDYELRAQTSDFVLPGDTVSWNDQTYTVRDVEPIAPDGIVIAARVTVSA